MVDIQGEWHGCDRNDVVPLRRYTYGDGLGTSSSSGRPQRPFMVSDPIAVGARGGTIHQKSASSGELFQVCFEGTCLFCESLHVGLAHLNRMERLAARQAA